MNRQTAQAEKILKEYYNTYECDNGLTLSTFTEFKTIDDKFAMLHTLTANKHTRYKVIPIRYMNQFNRIVRLKQALNENKRQYSFEVRESIQIKYNNLFFAIKNKINDYYIFHHLN